MDDTPGLGIALLLALAMAAIGFFCVAPLPALQGDWGVCLPGPSQWGLKPLFSWLCETALLAVTGFSLFSLNNRYNLEPGSQATASAFFFVSTAAVIPLSHGLTSALLMAPVTLICLSKLYAGYNQRNTSQSIFLAASLISLASMFCFAYVPLLIPLLASAAMLGQLGLRSAIAAIFGIAAPYVIWASVAFCGIAGELQLNDLIVYPEGCSLADNSIGVVTGAGIAMLASIILLLRETMAAATRNTRTKAFNAVINIWLICCLILLIVDFADMQVYLPTVNLLLGLRIAGLMGDRKFSGRTSLTLTLMTAYIALFVIQMIS